MTTRRDVVADDIFGMIQDRRWELEKKLRRGTLDPKKVADGLQQLIESCSLPKFPVWRTIRHFACRSAASYRVGRVSAGHKASDRADGLLDYFEVTSIDEEVDLGCASGADLGFKEVTRLDVIYDQIVACGGILCLPEDGPVLREQYPDQPEGERVLLAMKAIRGADRYLSIFSVVHNEYGLWLCRNYGYPDHLYYPGYRFVFRLHKRPLTV